jgi:hypothetical protein
MEGPTSPRGLRNRITRLTLREHDDDDDDDDDLYFILYYFCFNSHINYTQN